MEATSPTVLPSGQFPEQLAGVMVAGVDTKLGLIWIELANGPKIKVVARETFYHFRLRAKVIRVLKQWEITYQDGIVNALMTINKLQKLMVKTSSN
jgi:hypothetical protein